MSRGTLPKAHSVSNPSAISGAVGSDGTSQTDGGDAPAVQTVRQLNPFVRVLGLQGAFIAGMAVVNALAVTVTVLLLSKKSGEADQSDQMMIGWALGIWILATGVSMLGVMVLVGRLFVPIRSLISATRKLAEGDLSTRVPALRGDELGKLAVNFNHMADVVASQRGELLSANARLESQVYQRTKQWQEANERLLAEIAEKDEFLRAVSHDLGAPLRNIGGMAQLLVSRHGQTLPEDARQKIDRIIHNAGVGGQLIGELLELSRLKSKPISAECVNLGEMMKNLALLFEADLKGKAIELQIDPELPSVLGDASRLRQLFQNLIDNAIKYMGEAKERRIEVLGASVPGGTEITVSDTGPGIRAEDRQRVFCVFRRGTQAGAVPGKGVGLSWVKSIMELHGGTIELGASALGGCAFRLFFPKTDTAANDETESSTEATDSAEVETGANQTPIKLDAA